MPDAIPRGPFDQGLFLTHFNKGREAYEAKRYEEAERQLEEAYLLRPRDTRVLNLLGLVYFRADKLIKAEEVYRKLIAQNPDAHTLYYNLGLICFKLTRLEDAEQAFRKAAELSGGNPKIHFYLASIYERLQRYKDAIHNYRQAGANLMVQRVQVKLDRSGAHEIARPAGGSAGGSAEASAESTAEAAAEPSLEASVEPTAEEVAAWAQDRFRGHEDAAATLPPLPSREPRAPEPQDEEASAFLGEKVLVAVSPALLAGDGAPSASPVPGSVPPPSAHAFRSLERSLVEVEFSGRVFIKQGTIYSYSGNLTFWVKDERPGGHPPLAIVTGSGRLLLTDHDREITFLAVSPDDPVFVEPAHLLACEEGLEPRFETIAGQALVALEGSGTVALSVASKPLPLPVRPDQPVSIPAASLIAWVGPLAATVVEDPQIYAVVMPRAGGSRLLRLEGTGRVLVEQTAS